MASPQSVASVHHLHPVGDVCPTCDQPIPHDRAEEVARRLDEQRNRQAAELQEKFDLQLTEAAEQARLETDDKVAAARVEAKALAETAAQARIDAAAANELAAKQALEAKSAEVTAANAAVTKAQADAAEQLEQSAKAAEAQVNEVRAEAAEALKQATEQAASAAMESAAAKIQEAQAGKTVAEEASAALQARLAQSVQEREDAVALAKSEASSAAEARIAEAVSATQAAEAKAAAAVTDAETLKANQEVALAAALKEQRDALEADKVSAISAERSAAFEEKQRLSERVEALQRTLDRKTAEELGEGAEIDLFERLKGEFEDDRIERVKKGQPGADILHTVIHNGQVVGTIIYNSKNHGAWRNEFVTKLRADQLAAGAEHAILTAMKFPQGARQLHLQEGVLVANPARVIAIVELLRRHMIQGHGLRTSVQQRAEKTAALYDFMVSDQCSGMFERLEAAAQTLLEIQDAERAAHERVWKQQGLTIKSTQKVQAELRNKIDSIIGTASAPESQS